MSAPRTARARARELLIADIKAVARRQIAGDGAAQLSLRAITRDLGMSSSAIYRYFASRDDLLTALIIDSYESLGSAVGAAVEAIPQKAHRSRWLAASGAMRRWATKNPHEFSLLYGSPVPDYEAPPDTIAPAGRAVESFVAIVAAAAVDGSLAPPNDPPVAVVADFEAQLKATADLLAPDVPPLAMARLFQALSQMVGIIGLEMNGHLVGTLDPADLFFDLAVTEDANRMGLSDLPN